MMSAKKKPVDDASARVVATAIERTKEEVSAHYAVADHAKLDWCPCCGVNLRLYDARGRLISKLIMPHEGAMALAWGILELAREMKRMLAEPGTEQRLLSDIAAAVAGDLQRAELRARHGSGHDG